ncbi:MAG: hypothetical protein ACKVOU_00755 [Cytophagales bacterium]
MKNINIFILLIFLATGVLHAQYYTADREAAKVKTKRALFDDWKERIYFGGNIGLGGWPSSRYFYIEAAPLIGYRITDRFSVGNTFTYIYLKQSILYSKGGFNNTLDYSSHIFGVSPFARMFLTDWFFLHGEYNIFSGHLIKERDTGPDYLYTERGFVAYPLIGGGFVYSFGNRGGIMIMALFNPLYSSIKDKFPIYNSPLVLRIGFFI